MKKRALLKEPRVLLAAGAGIAAVTFTGVFMSGCGSSCDCLPYDAGGDVTSPDATADAAGDAKADAAGDAGSSDAASDAASDAPADAPADATSE